MNNDITNYVNTYIYTYVPMCERPLGEQKGIERHVCEGKISKFTTYLNLYFNFLNYNKKRVACFWRIK